MMDWAGLLTVATAGIGMLFDFSSGSTDTHDDTAAVDVPEDDVSTDMTMEAFMEPFEDSPEEDFYAVADFYPTIDPEEAILPWGDHDADAHMDDSDFVLALAA